MTSSAHTDILISDTTSTGGEMKTAKILGAVAYELVCPDCGPEYAEVEGPWGSVSVVYHEEFNDTNRAYCITCGEHLKMPRIPKKVRSL